MNLGSCQSCGNRNELHEDVDGKWVCEACKMSGTALGRKVQGAQESQQIQQEQTYRPSQKVILLDFIVTHAEDKWIDNFIAQFLKRKYDALLQEKRWIELLEEEKNERVLLRIASEMGFNKPVPKPPTPPPPPVGKANVIDPSDTKHPKKRTYRKRIEPTPDEKEPAQHE